MGNKKPVGKPPANDQPVGEPADAPPEGKRKRKTEPAQLPADLVDMLNVVADYYGTTVGKLIDPQIRPWLTAAYGRVLRERLQRLGDATAHGG